MKKHINLATLSDRDGFTRERRANWERGVDYWLKGPLRHVVDVGNYIADRTAALCRVSGSDKPVVVDMGFGDGWLLRALLDRKVPLRYIGLDFMHPFVQNARVQFSSVPEATFEWADFEVPNNRKFSADVVVNSFNFFELCELAQPFRNAAQFLRPGGVLHVSTIDKTYLILALSNSWGDFIDKLRLYQSLQGTKYAFQPIDLGNAVSADLYYPSVLYSTEDFLSAATESGLVFKRYKEHAFTGAVVPKIYCHYEFEKPQGRMNHEA